MDNNIIENKKKRIVLEVSPEMHKRLKIKAAQESISITSLLVDLIHEHLVI